MADQRGEMTGDPRPPLAAPSAPVQPSRGAARSATGAAETAELLAAARQAEFEGRIDDAIARYRQAFEITPEEGAAFAGLESLYRAREAWSSLAALYRLRLEQDGGSDWRLQVRLAQVLNERLRDAEGARALLAAAAQRGAGRTALEPLARLHAQAGRLADALAATDALLALGVDRKTRAEWLERAAEWLTGLGDLAGARARRLAAFEATPDVLPRAFAAREAAGPEHELATRIDAAILERLPATDGRRAEVLEAQARRWVAAGRNDEADPLFTELLVLAPGNAAARAFVAERLERMGDRVGLAELRLSEALAIQEPAARLAALRGLAEWAEQEAPGVAVRVWRAVVALRPQDTVAQQTLARHLAAAQDWGTQVEVLIDRLSHTRGEARRRALYLEIAEIFESRLEQPEAAWEALKEAFSETLDDAAFGPRLGRVARRAERMPELVALYEQTLALFEEGAPVAPLRARVGRWRAEDLRDPAGGVAHLEAALQLEPGHAAALDGLFALAQSGFAAALPPLSAGLRRTGDFERLYAVERRCLDAHPRGAPRAQALLGLSRLCEQHLGRPDEALAWLEEAVVEHPADPSLQSELTRLASQLDAPEALAEALERAVAVSAPPLRLDLARALVAQREALGDTVGTAAAWRLVLADQPSAPDALEALDLHATAVGDDALLIEVLGRRLLGAGGAARARLAERLADACVRAGDAEGELRALRAWVGGDPRGPAGRRRLATRLWAQQDARGTYEALRPLADADDPEAQLVLATLCVGPLARHAEAAHRARAVLRLRAPALLTAEERSRLLAVLTTVGDAEGEVQVLLAALAAADGDLAALHTAIARRTQGEVARTHWAAVLAAQPADAEALEALDAHYAAEAPAHAHLAILDARVARALVHAPESALALLGRRARVRAALDDHAGAEADLRQVLAAQPDDDAHLAALDALYADSGDVAARAEILARRVSCAPTPAARLERLWALAAVDRGPRGEAALEALAAAPDASGRAAAALEELVVRCLNRGAPLGAVAALDAAAARAAARSGGAKAARALADRATHLLATAAGDPVAAYERIAPDLGRRLASPTERAQVVEITARAQRWADLVARTDAAAARCAAPTALELRICAAQWVAEHLPEGPEAAADRLLAVLASHPVAPAAEQALLALIEAGVAVDRAGPVLAARHAQRRDAGHELKVLQVVANRGTGASRRRAREALAAHAGEAGRDAEAFEWRRLVFLEAPEDEDAERNLLAAAAELGAFTALAETYCAGIEAAGPDPRAVRRLGHRALDLLRGRAADPAAADAVAARVLRDCPADATALQHLAPKLRAAGHHEPLAGLLDAAVAALPDAADETRRLRFTFEAGEAHAAAGRSAEALERFGAVLALVPDHADALDHVERLRAEAGDAAGVYSIMCSRAAAAPRDPSLRVRCARLAEGLGRHEEAVEAWQAALDLGADEATVLAALEPLLTALDHPASLVEVLERQRSLARDGRAVVALDRRLGALYAGPLDRPDAALGCYAAVLRRVPDDLDALRAAHALHDRMGDPGGRAQIEARLLGLLPAESPERPELLRALARNYQALDRHEDARAAWYQLWSLGHDDAETAAALDRLTAAGEAPPVRAALLRHRAERLAETDAPAATQAAVWLDLVDLFDAQPDGLEAAREACRAAANLVPESEAVLDRLEALHARAAAHADLAWLLGWRLDHAAADSALRSGLLWRLARVHADHLAEPARATELLGLLVAQLPTRGIIAALASAAAAGETWSQAVWAVEAALAAQAEVSPGAAPSAHLTDPSAPEAAPAPLADIELRLVAAEWRAAHLHDPEGALAHCEAALAVAPRHAAARLQAEQLWVQLGRWDALVAHLTPTADLDATTKRTAWDAVATVHERRRRDPAAARAVYDRLLAADPADTAAREAVERLSAQLDDWAGLAERVRSHAETLADDGARADRLVRLGDLYAGPLAAPEAALAAYREALRRAPEHPAASGQFEALCLKTGHLDLLNAWYAERIAQASGAEARSLGRKRAEVQARIEARTATPGPEAPPELDATPVPQASAASSTPTASGSAAEAPTLPRRPSPSPAAAAAAARRAVMEAARRAAAGDPERPDPTGVDPDRTSPAVEAASGDPGDRAADHLDAARADLHGGEGAHTPTPRTAIDSPAGADPATRALEAAYRAEGRFAELAALYRRRLAVVRDRAAAETIEAALLDLYLGPADEPARAAAMLRPRLAHEKRPRFLLQQLAALYARAEDWPACVEMLKLEVELADLRDAERLPLFDRLARICAEHLGDRARAAGWWRAALEFDADDAAARKGLVELAGAAEAEAAARSPRPDLQRRPGRGPSGPPAVRTFTVRAKNPARRRQLLRAAAAAGIFWALVATAAFVIQSMRLDRSADEMQTATKAYDRLAREVNATQTEFTAVARVLHQAHGTGDAAELFATDDVPVGEAAAETPMMDRVLSMAINNLKMRNAVTNVGSLVANVVEQREAAKVQAEQFASRIEGMQGELAKLTAAKGVTDELLARRLDENIEQVEVALGFTGLDLDAVATNGVPSGDSLTAVEDLPPGLPVEAAGGPWQAATVNYASPLPGMSEVMSGFGWRGKEHHNGIDIPGEVGDPVRAVGEGEVIYVQSRAAWEASPKFIERDGKKVKAPAWRAGVYVEIKHPDERVSRYLHLDDVAPGIEPGVRVRKRQVIGSLGRTAVEHSATHLHFELREPPTVEGGRWGNPINPETPLSNVDATAFAQGSNRLHAETAQLTRALTGGSTFTAVGLGLEEAPEREAQLENNATAEILASLGTQGRVKRLQDLEKLLRSLPLVAPVDDFKVSSGFGKRSDPMDPSLDGLHTGIDIPGEERTEILATAPGVVTFSGWQGGFGRMVEIDHGNGVKTRYGHLYKSLVPVGQQVGFREKIGQMGSSGRSTGVHLHYEIVVNDEPVDPLRYMRAGRALFNE